MSIKDRAIQANERFIRQTDDLFRIHSEMKFEELFGDVKYETESTENNLIIKSEGYVFLCDCDDDGDTLFRLVKKCPECGEIYSEPFTSLPELGNRFTNEMECECEHKLELLPTKDAMKEIENGQRTPSGYIMNGCDCGHDHKE